MLNITPRGNKVYVPDGKVLTEYFWDRSKMSIIQGPIGSGTSTASCMKIYAIACEQLPDYDGVRRTRWVISRETYKELEETTIKTWLMWFPENEWGPLIRAQPPFHHIKRKHPSGDGTLIDMEVIFLALPDDETAEKVLASMEITGFFKNEMQGTSKFITTELLSRCSRYPSKMNGPGATWFGGLGDLNAPVEGHWIPYMRGDIPVPPDWTDDQKAEYQKPDNWRFYVQPPGLIEVMVDGKIQYQPNPAAENQKHLTEPYIDKIKGWDKPKIDRRVMNKVGLHIEGKAVYPTFSEADHVSKTPLAPIQGFDIVVGLDFGNQPAAVFMQNIHGSWRALSELFGPGDSSALFAPKVKRHLAEKFPGFFARFSGDPRGADKNQATETTSYDVFLAYGMRVYPATTDNNVQLRRSTVTTVLARRNGLLIDPSCLLTKTGFAGGYHFRKMNIGTAGIYSDKPQKNVYSHVIEAVENALIGGGEGDAMIVSESRPKPPPPTPLRHKVKLRRLG